MAALVPMYCNMLQANGVFALGLQMSTLHGRESL